MTILVDHIWLLVGSKEPGVTPFVSPLKGQGERFGVARRVLTKDIGELSWLHLVSTLLVTPNEQLVNPSQMLDIGLPMLLDFTCIVMGSPTQ